MMGVLVRDYQELESLIEEHITEDVLVVSLDQWDSHQVPDISSLQMKKVQSSSSPARLKTSLNVIEQLDLRQSVPSQNKTE